MVVCQVVVYELQCHLSCFVVCLVDDVDGARNKQHGLLAMLGHSCTLLGFSEGGTDRANFAPHTQVRYPGGLRGEGPAVYTHDPTPTSAITCAVSGHTTPHPDNPVATTSRVGPPPGTPVHMKPHRSGPGIARASRTSACPLPDAPHLADPVPPLNFVDGQLDLRCHCSPWLWRPGRRGRRTCPWPGGPVSRGTCRRAVEGRLIVGSILRTFSRPSTAIHKVARCFSNISSLKRTHATG